MVERVAWWRDQINEQNMGNQNLAEALAELEMKIETVISSEMVIKSNKHTLPDTLDPAEQRKANARLREEIDAMPTQNMVSEKLISTPEGFAIEHACNLPHCSVCTEIPTTE